MAAGITDGRFLTPAGILTYGVTGLFVQPGQVNAHGLNEKIPVESLYQSREFSTGLYGPMPTGNPRDRDGTGGS